MRKTVHITVDPDFIHDHDRIRTLVEESAPGPFAAFEIVRRSVDARSKRPRYLLQVMLDPPQRPHPASAGGIRPTLRSGPGVVVVGAGPAGYFAALALLKRGIRPTILERGGPVAQRRKDIAAMLRSGRVDPVSNYCFGEGGAGAYSDGKLYTRATKRGDVSEILDLFIAHGAPEDIRVDAHPHIGSNRLPRIIAAMRQTILEAGGAIYFHNRATDFIIRRDRVHAVVTETGDVFEAEAVILATGHSARDIYNLLRTKGVTLAPKPFAVGVRLEHPQELIDQLLYHQAPRHENLPAAAYRFAEQVADRGVYSFCMCPGGLVVPAATGPGEVVVNGMSNAARNSPFANAGIVVEVRPEDIGPLAARNALDTLAYQQALEARAFAYGGANGQTAPAQRLTDFLSGTLSDTLPPSSYIPGLQPARVDTLLPEDITRRLRAGLTAFGKKRRGFLTREALVLAVESRTSAPVRIPRDPASLLHPELGGLYPCGEGAGYAGGIVSSAMDGLRVARKIAEDIFP